MRATTKTRTMVIAAVMTAVSIVLMAFEMPLPFMPPFLKLDLSAVPILIAAFMFGPGTATMMSATKALLHLTVTSTAGVGELADFIITASFAVSAALVYKYYHSKKGALLACGTGVVAITAAGALANKFLLIPFFSQTMPMDVIFNICGELNPFIKDLNSYILYGAIPFNMIKGTVIAAVTFLVYKKLHSFILKFM